MTYEQITYIFMIMAFLTPFVIIIERIMDKKNYKNKHKYKLFFVIFYFLLSIISLYYLSFFIQ
jgi:hypothetical protein